MTAKPAQTTEALDPMHHNLKAGRRIGGTGLVRPLPGPHQRLENQSESCNPHSAPHRL